MMRGTVRLEFGNRRVAEQVHTAISPDNRPLPSDLVIESKLMGDVIEITVSTAAGTPRLMATLEDLLSSVDLALRTISEVATESDSDQGS